MDGVGRDGGAQLELDQTPDLDARVHRRLERAPAAAAVGFRRIERDVGVGEQRVGGQAVVGSRRGPDACPHHDFAAVDHHRFAGRLDDQPRQFRRRRLVRIVAMEDDELVAAPAGDQIPRPDEELQPPRDLQQKFVSGAMAEAVVDLLEIVEVEEHHREARVARGPRVQRGAEGDLEAVAVRELGDRVEMRHAVDDAVGVAFGRHVLNHQHRAVVGHAVDNRFDRAPVLRLDRHQEVALVSAAKDRVGERDDRGLIEAAGCDELADDHTPMRAGWGIGAQAENGKELVIGEDQSSLSVNHAQPVRHIVERGVEPLGQQSALVAGLDLRDEGVPYPPRCAANE